MDNGINGITSETGSSTVDKDSLEPAPNEQDSDRLPSDITELNGVTTGSVNGATLTEPEKLVMITVIWTTLFR